jgi:hypothetical protein
VRRLHDVAPKWEPSAGYIYVGYYGMLHQRWHSITLHQRSRLRDVVSPICCTDIGIYQDDVPTWRLRNVARALQTPRVARV